MTQDEASSNLPINQESLQLETYLVTLRKEIEKLEKQKLESLENLKETEKIKEILEKLKTEESDLKSSIDSSNDVKKILDSAIADLTKIVSDLKSSIDVSRETLSNLDIDKTNKQEEVDAINLLITNAKKQYIEVHSALEQKNSSMRDVDATLKARIEEVDKEVDGKKQELIKIQQSINTGNLSIEKQVLTISDNQKLIDRAVLDLKQKQSELSESLKSVTEKCSKVIAESDKRVSENKIEIEKLVVEKNTIVNEKTAAQNDLDEIKKSKVKTIEERDIARKFIEEKEQAVELIKRNALIEIARIAKQQSVKIDKSLIEGLLTPELKN